MRLTFKQRDDDQHQGHRRRHLEAVEGDLEEAGTSDSSTHNLRDNAGSVQWRQHCRRTKSVSSEAILTRCCSSRGSICCVNGRGREGEQEKSPLSMLMGRKGNTQHFLLLGMCQITQEGIGKFTSKVLISYSAYLRNCQALNKSRQK